MKIRILIIPVAALLLGSTAGYAQLAEEFAPPAMV